MAEYLHRPLDSCALCGLTDLECVASFAAMPIATPNFKEITDPALAEAATRGVPLDLMVCRNCGQLQVGQVGNPELQYRDYVYTTSLSLGLAEHFRRHVAATLDRLTPPAGGLVLEIGSNDGTLLSFFKERGFPVQGVDPARAIAAQATARGIPTRAEFFGLVCAQSLHAGMGSAVLILANNVIANIADLQDFSRGIKAVMAPKGVFVFETQYGADVVDRLLVDTIYHEHISYFMIRPLRDHFRRLGLELFDVERIPTKGGSIRVSVQHVGASRSVAPIVAELIAQEEAAGMFGPGYYQPMMTRIEALKNRLQMMAASERAAGFKVAGYGVSVGTLTMLAQFGLTHLIDVLIDDDPNKPGILAGPSYSIPVRRAEALTEENSRLCVIFAWRYADAIIAKQEPWRKAGGRFIVPLPEISII
jgi:SAM-dependent methyltransferase